MSRFKTFNMCKKGDWYWLHVFFYLKTSVRSDPIPKLLRLLEDEASFNEWTFELREKETLLQMTVRCDPPHEDRALRDLSVLMQKCKVSRDWTKPHHMLTKHPTYMSQEDIERVKKS
jgi:hypothetical protein